MANTELSTANTVVAELSALYESCAGSAPEEIVPLSSSGSHRRYYRITGKGGDPIIGVAGTDPHENVAFCAIDRHFSSKGIAVPKVLAISHDHIYYLQEDLGRETLFDKIAPGRMSGRYSESEIELLEAAVSRLPVIQIEGAEGLDFSKCYPKSSFDRMSVMFDFHYFKYCFLKNTGFDFNEVKLERAFEDFADILLSCKDNGFMYRDFQSRNVMVKDGEPYFIDFQDGRYGPIYYDVASFIWQARSAFPGELKRRLIDAYLGVLSRYKDVSVLEFMEQLRRFVLFRTLQVLGAYGFRGYMEKKRHFIESIPFAVKNLSDLLSEDSDPVFSELPPLQETLGGCTYLLSVLSQMTKIPGLTALDKISTAADEAYGQAEDLTVEIISFSYKNGIPQDGSGHGGGYIFDCRAIHNPGRYEQYKYLTGMDPEVKFFLERNGEVLPFMENVSQLVEAHVAKFIRRGFTHLTVCFGCTGGQHRSVYCAETLASRLAGRPGVKVRLIHREQGISKSF